MLLIILKPSKSQSGLRPHISRPDKFLLVILLFQFLRDSKSHH